MNINFIHQLSPKFEQLINKLITIGERIVATNEQTAADLQAVKASLDALTAAVDTLIAKAQQADVTDPAVEAAANDVKAGVQALTDKVNAAITPPAPPTT